MDVDATERSLFIITYFLIRVARNWSWMGEANET